MSASTDVVGRQVIFTLAAEPVDEDEHPGRVQAVMSAESIDRYGDVIEQEGWVLDNFLRHPVMLAGHNSRDITAQIGEWRDVRVDLDADVRRLVGVAEYYLDEGNDQAEYGWRMARRRRAAYSVGFMPIEMELLDEDGHSWWGPWRFLQQELLETSHVTVPAHPDALLLASPDRRRELADYTRVAQFIGRAGAPVRSAWLTPPRTPEPQARATEAKPAGAFLARLDAALAAKETSDD